MSNSGEVFELSLLTEKEIKEQLDYCIKQVDKGIERYRYGFFPARSCASRYDCIYNGGWTNGFWTAMVLLAYEMTGDEKYKAVVLDHLNSYRERLLNKFSVDHHDLGFEYSLSCVSAYKILGIELAKDTAIMAADFLCERFVEPGGYIKPWSSLDDPEENRIIVDTYLNLPLLFWASEVSGNEKYRSIAIKHLETSVDILVREDGRAYHTFMMELKYGNPIEPRVDQGYANDSVWSRGQAWVIYGLALAYSYTGDEKLAAVQKKAANKFIELLPSDNIPAWDMVFTNPKILKDTSAAVIAACGMLEMNKLDKNHPDCEKWTNKVHDMLRELWKNHCTNGNIDDTSAILMHGTGDVRRNSGVNESLIYGDYYYMEALVRLMKPDWVRYW